MATPLQGAQSQYVRLREVDHMDIIAHTRPVAGWVIIAKNGNHFAFGECDLQNQRDEVKLRVMVLTSSRSRSGGIEITQTRKAYST